MLYDHAVELAQAVGSAGLLDPRARLLRVAHQQLTAAHFPDLTELYEQLGVRVDGGSADADSARRGQTARPATRTWR